MSISVARNLMTAIATLLSSDGSNQSRGRSTLPHSNPSPQSCHFSSLLGVISGQCHAPCCCDSASCAFLTALEKIEEACQLKKEIIANNTRPVCFVHKFVCGRGLGFGVLRRVVGGYLLDNIALCLDDSSTHATSWTSNSCINLFFLVGCCDKMILSACNAYLFSQIRIVIAGD